MKKSLLKVISIVLCLIMVIPFITACGFSYEGETLKDGKVGNPYSAFVATATGKEKIEYDLKRGQTLPEGLDINPDTGEISGTPLEACNNKKFIVVAIDMDSEEEVEAEFAITIKESSISYTGKTLANAKAGVDYETSIAASIDSAALLSYTLKEGSRLPSGLVIEGDKIIGVPKESVADMEIVLVASAYVQFGSKTEEVTGISPKEATFKLTVTSPVITYVGMELPKGEIGTPYNQSIATAITDVPDLNIDYTLIGDLPSGLRLNSNGSIIGTPDEAVEASFDIAASVYGAIAETTFSIVIEDNRPRVTYAGNVLSGGQVGVAYDQSIATATASSNGGTVTYELKDDSTLPAGLRLEGGRIVGTPTEAVVDKTFIIVANETDALSAEANFTLTVIPKSISYTGGVLTNGKVGRTYSQSVATATFDTAVTIVYTLKSGTLPAGLNLTAAGIIEGTPTAEVVNKTFTVTAAADGATSKDAEFTLTITQNAPILSYKGGTLENAKVGMQYSQSVATAVADVDGTPVTYALKSGSNLPNGLSMSDAGLITGIPTLEAENATFTVVAEATGSASVEAAFTLTVTSAETIITYQSKTLADGEINVPYDQAATATADVAGTVISYALKDGSTLPAGLTLLAATGHITGTPTAVVTNKTFAIIASAEGALSKEATFTLTVLTPAPVITYNTSTLANAKVGRAFTASVGTASATPTATISYALDTGSSLPSGLTLAANGSITGTPAAAATVTFTVVASAPRAIPKTATFTLTIDPIIITYSGGNLAAGIVDAQYSASVASAQADVAGTSITYSLKTGSTLPAGLNMSSSGAITGFPSEAVVSKSFTVIARATGATSVEATFTISIDAAYAGIRYEGRVLNDGLVGTAYTANLGTASVSGGATITYSIRYDGPELPVGLSFNSMLGRISGTPLNSTSGTLTFKVRASAVGYDPVEAEFTVRILDKEVTTNRFEAEHIDLSGKKGSGYSNAAEDVKMIRKPAPGKENLASGGSFLGYLHNSSNVEGFTFKFTSDKAATADLTFRLSSEIGTITLDDSIFVIEVNGVEWSYDEFTIKGANEYPESEYVSEPGGALNTAPFQTFNLGSVNLNAGENTITFKIMESDIWEGRSAGGPEIDYLELTDISNSAVIKWRPKTYNLIKLNEG